MKNMTNQSSVLLVKYDGIGDYLRLFWPQVAQVAKQKNWDLSFLCTQRYAPLVKKYDFPFFSRWFVEPIFGFRIIQYYRKYFYKVNLWKKQWDCIYSGQTCRDVVPDRIFKRLLGTSKISVRSVNEFTAPKGSYSDVIYTKLLDVSQKQFILSFYKDLLEKMFEVPFSLPKLELPFSSQDIQATLQKYKLASQQYIAFVPFTSTSLRDWPIKNFIQLANDFAKYTSRKIIILGNKKTFCNPLWKECPNVVNLLGKTNLLEAMQLAAGAIYAVCSDTSLMHCALMGGANTISLSSGLSLDMFVRYPEYAKVKQKIFSPAQLNEKGIGRMEDIPYPSVWEYIKEHWLQEMNE